VRRQEGLRNVEVDQYGGSESNVNRSKVRDLAMAYKVEGTQGRRYIASQAKTQYLYKPDTSNL